MKNNKESIVSLFVKQIHSLTHIGLRCVTILRKDKQLYLSLTLKAPAFFLSVLNT